MMGRPEVIWSGAVTAPQGKTPFIMAGDQTKAISKSTS